MARNTPSRDQIAHDVFGRKFSALELDQKQYVNKLLGVLYNASRQGGDPSRLLSTAAMNETAKIVKQLKEIATNPGDVISLPNGVYQDAARVIHYQSQAKGRGRLLDPREMDKIKKEIAKEFGRVNPGLVTGITDYLTNATGRFSGVGSKVLRSKLGSFLTKGELESISNAEILAARDIVVSHLFDKWSGGNLSSFVRPRVEDLLSADLKKLQKSSAKSHNEVVKKEVLQKTIESLEFLESLHKNPQKLNTPVMKKALSNLGLTPYDILKSTTKEHVSNIQDAAYKQATKRVKLSGGLRSGGGLRRRPRLLTRASSEYLGSIPKSYPITGIGKKTIIKSKWSGSEFRTHLPKMIESSGDDDTYLSKLGDYLASETADFSSIQSELEYGVNPIKPKPAKMDVGPMSVVEHATSLIEPYVASVTKAEATMGLQRHYHDLYLNDLEAYENARDTYVDRYGDYQGRIFHEAGVPFGIADKVMCIRDKAARNDKVKEVVDWYTSNLSRYERQIGINPDEIRPFEVAKELPGIHMNAGWGDPIMHAVSKFVAPYGERHTPADIKEEVETLLKSGGDGGKRVGVVGSKSWDNEPFMRKFWSKNYNASDVMVTSSELGQSPVDEKVKFGAAYQASNALHFLGAFENKLPVRVEWMKRNTGKQYREDFTTADVINNSDEIVAFFDEMYLSPSGRKQMNKLAASIGDKPCRIIWVPSNTAHPEGSIHTGQYALNLFGDKSNVKFEKYYPGALPAGMSDKGFKFLAKGGSLKSNEMAIVGEAGPEMLVPSGNGGFNVIPNKALRYLAEGTLPLASYARNVTGEPQPDEHDYTDPKTGEVWPSVTKIKNLGKAYNGGAYYGHVGSAAHYYAAMAMGQKHGIDTSHIPFPEVEGGKDLKGKYHSAEDIIQNGRAIADKFVELADELGFVPTMIEQRFVNERDKYSGTLDIAGFIRDEVGNLIPTIADFKSSSKVDADFAEQIAAYADFFQDSVKGFVINVTRDLTSVGNYEMDLTKGFAGWQKKLQAYNEKFRSGVSVSTQEDAIANRLDKISQMAVSVFDVRSGEEFPRTMGTSNKGNAAALGKLFPKFDAQSDDPNYRWDKNPSRLRVFSARLDELYGARSDEMHPHIRGHLDTLKREGWDAQSLSMLAEAPMGSYPDKQETIKLFDHIYQTLKPITFNQGLLETGVNSDKMLWEDARTLVNILEEAGKSFESVQYFAKKTSKSPLIPTTVPGPGMPGVSSASPGTPQPGLPGGIEPPTKTKCKGVDLCQPTLNRFESWFAGIRKLGGGTSTGGGTPISTKGSTTGGSGGSGDIDYEKMFREKFLGEVEHPKGWRKYIERAPVTGLPFQMKRKEKEYGKRILQADTDTTDWASLAPKGYWKLLDKETHARNSYFRSLRGATTSWLIAAHVMRIFGQTSQVYNKAHESVMKGFGYIIDMFLMPIIPYLAPVVKGLVMIGNVIRQIPAMAIVGGVLIGKLIWDTYQWFKAVGAIPKVINAASAAIDKLTGALERIFPIPDEISNLHLNEERGLVPYTEHAEAYRGRMVNQSRMLPPGKTYETDFYAPETGPASGKSGKYDIIPGVNWTFGGPGVRPPEKKRPIPKGFLGDIPYYNKGGVVPGVGNKDSVLAMLTPGEVVISKNNLPHYADGGIVGGVIGNVLGLYGNIMSTDIAQSIVGGLGVVSKAVGAMMAPLAPVMAMGAIGGKGWAAVRNAVTRGTSITTQIQEGGFSSLRTVGSGILMNTILIAGAAIGILNLLSGLQPVMPTGNMPKFSATDALKGVAERIRAIWEEIKAKALEKWEQIKAKAWEIWEKIRSKALEIWERIKAPFERVKTFIDTIFDKFKGVVDTLRTAFERAKLALDPLIERFKGMAEFIKTHFPDIGKGGKGVIESVKEFGGKALEKVTKGGYLPTAGLVGLNEIFKGETDPVKILTAVAPAMAGQWVFNKLGGMQALAGAGGQALLGGAGGFLANPFFKDLGSNAENFFRRITGGEESENAWGGRMIASTAGSVLMGVPGVVGAGLNDWYNNLTEVFGKMSSGDLPFITGNNQGVVGTAMKETWNAYGNIVQAFKGEYEQGNSLIFDAIYNAGASFRDGATKFIGDLQSGFTNIVNTIISIPEMIMTKLATIADDIKNAIINSITGTGKGILDAGSNAVNSVVDVAQKLPIPKFDTGGYVGKSGLAWVDKGESITTIGAPSTRTATNTDLLHAVQDLKDALKQPTVNYNTIEMANSDPYALFQQFVQWLGTSGNTQGLQRSI